MTTPPLSHLRVLECATFVAGPSCGMTLGQLGAEVLRVDLPQGGSDHQRWPLATSGASLYWANLNKGKRSVTIDYRLPAGRELVVELATRPGAGSGVFVDNLVGRSALTRAELLERRSDMITMRILGFPDGRPAVDYTVNAAVGVPYMTGLAGSGEPVNHVLPAWDLLTGAMAAVGLLAAVTQRQQTGEGADLQIALADVALSGVGALGWLAEALQDGPRAAHGNHVFGSFGTDFATSDGERVMIVALTQGQWQALCDVTGTGAVFDALESALGTDLREESARYELRETIGSILRPWFSARPIAEVREDLDRARVLWGPYRTMSDAAALARQDATSVASEVEQPGIGRMLATTIPVRWNGGTSAPAPAPVLGADTEQVLAEELGLSGAEIGALLQRGVVGVPGRAEAS
ncbi:dehydratase [Intrasporangium chromatireducens Q5-1]|uniref:Dehydratase n=1 Tax=Intrasporangium chromatireducens Q5-1 TaxID=584657 RepID=W9GR18_9MICO|nr:CoA transferase [Intrasporangium chromatireducens]EWT06334.1 dehydratase [Intrasporangium chromatireducens Q5-1]